MCTRDRDNIARAGGGKTTQGLDVVYRLVVTDGMKVKKRLIGWLLVVVIVPLIITSEAIAHNGSSRTGFNRCTRLTGGADGNDTVVGVRHTKLVAHLVGDQLVIEDGGKRAITHT